MQIKQNKLTKLQIILIFISLTSIAISLFASITDYKNFYITLMGLGLFFLAISETKRLSKLRIIANICFFIAFLWGAFIIKGYLGILLIVFSLIIIIITLYILFGKSKFKSME